MRATAVARRSGDELECRRRRPLESSALGVVIGPGSRHRPWESSSALGVGESWGLAVERNRMARPRQDVTERELEILEILWGSGGATIRGIADRIYPRGGFAHYTTVKKLIERLEEKGFVTRRTDRTAHEFSAAVGREEL